MQNIQDLKEKIFFESKNIIDILDKISNINELLSKQDLVDDLANRISFLLLLEKNIEYFGNENSISVTQTRENRSLATGGIQDLNDEVTEEEAIFNNELNEIDKNGNESFSNRATEEEAIFNNQLNEIVEGELHETLVNFAEENSESESIEDLGINIYNDVTEEEAIFNNQLNEIDENEPSDYTGSALNFVDEERILADSEPENDDDIHEGMFNEKITEEEVIFNNQLNEIDEFENEISDDQGNLNGFDEEEKIQDIFESKNKEETLEAIPSIFDTEILEDDEEILVEETEERFIASNVMIEQGEMATDTSNVDNILSEIKNEAIIEEKQEQSILAEINDRRKIVEINRAVPETEKEKLASDESFENLEDYQNEKKIKLANIKGMKAVQSLFDDDHLDREMPKEKTVPVEKEDTGSILKTNIPTNFMEAGKSKPDFKLDLNDRIAFSKMLFGGSQSEMNQVIGNLNSFSNLEDAKEYLSDLYYHKKWNKVDEYAQRLWILVENKFL